MTTSDDKRVSGAVRGWGLLELVIVVFLLGLLAAIAYPSYLAHMQRAHRLRAQTALVQAAHHVLRQAPSVPDGVGSAVAPLPASLAQVPHQGPAMYRISVQGSTHNFVLSAIPVGAMRSDGCGILTLDALGVRSATGQAGDHRGKSCWQ